MEAFYTSLAAVVNTSKKRAKDLVTNYNSGDLGFFQTYFDGLKAVKFEIGETINNSVNLTLFVEENSLGAGAMGVIKKNRAKPYVYKSMANMWPPEKRLFYLKSIFREAIVQTLLQSDKSFGKYVCKLSAVYREGDNCVFQLEPLGITLAKYLVSDHKAVVPILVRLVEIISYFKTKYGFSHNDLKLNNVMTGEGNAIGNLKLIDFGLSSIKIGTNEIGKPSLSKADMPYLFHNLKMELEGKAYASNNVDEELLASDLFKLAESLSELPAETPIKTYIDRLQGLKGGFRNTRRLRRLRLATRTRKNMY